MGKKYIIEIIGGEEGDMDFSTIEPYTEPDLHEVRKKAYENGYHDAAYNCHEGCNFLDDAKKKADEEYRRGYADCEAHYKAMVQDSDTTEGADAYQRGLADAWDAARKIIHMPEGDLLNIFTECYSAVCTALQVLLKYDASECIEKIQAYEQEEIKVGDEVIRHYKSEFAEGDDAPSIFLSEEDGYFRCLAFNGRSIMIAEYPKNQYRKTGRHFPEIATVLKKMRGEQDG